MKTKIYLIGFFVLSALNVCFSAPAGGGSGVDWKKGCWPPPCVPIDGGISLLIAAGAIYGGSKLYSKQKTKNKETTKNINNPCKIEGFFYDK